MSTTAPSSDYTAREEFIHGLSHGLGALLSVVGLAVLVTLTASRGDAWRVVSTAIFGASLVFLYTSSTLYHVIRAEPLKARWRKIDHAAIFVLIAGSYTPFLLVNLRGPWGWSLFGIVWGLAAVGMVLKFWFTGRFRFASTLLYLGMGWLLVVAVRPLLAVVPSTGLWWLLAGGLCYTGGTIFYMWKSRRYHHAVWHGCVLAGSICHFFAVLRSVVPPAACTPAGRPDGWTAAPLPSPDRSSRKCRAGSPNPAFPLEIRRHVMLSPLAGLGTAMPPYNLFGFRVFNRGTGLAASSRASITP